MARPQKVVVIFNGPPGSGKDESTGFCVDMLEPAYHMMFKEKLFELVLSIFNIPNDEFFELYNNRETKNEPTCKLNGFSPREAMIYVSETIIKPNFGKDYFGLIAAENMDRHGIYFYSDGGFEEELKPVYEECDGHMLIVRLHREGCDYKEDSRGYIHNFFDATEVDVYNDSTIENFQVNILNTVMSFLESIEGV